MDPRRARTERNMIPAVGAAFFRGEGGVQFQFVIDSGNVIGPRPATRSDQEKHPDAWAAFCAAEDVSSLDRDASGGDGGSLPSEPESVRVPVEVSFGGGSGNQTVEIIVGAGGGSGGSATAKKPRKPYTRRKKG